MRVEEIKFTRKKKEIKFNLSIPENFKEAMTLMDEKEVYTFFIYGYKELSKLRQIGRDPTKPRKKIHTIDVSKLDEKTLEGLKKLGILPARV